MPISKSEYEGLVKQAETARSNYDQAKGQLKAALARLKEEFGCKDLTEARALHKKLGKQLTEAEENYNAEKKAFDEEWGDYVEELEN